MKTHAICSYLDRYAEVFGESIPNKSFVYLYLGTKKVNCCLQCELGFVSLKNVHARVVVTLMQHFRCVAVDAHVTMT